MSTTQHTGHYNLPTFGDNPNDRPSWRGDFTDAMTKIDNQMYTNATNIITATATAQQAKEVADNAEKLARTNKTDIDKQASYFNALGINDANAASASKNKWNTASDNASYAKAKADGNGGILAALGVTDTSTAGANKTKWDNAATNASYAKAKADGNATEIENIKSGYATTSYVNSTFLKHVNIAVAKLSNSNFSINANSTTPQAITFGEHDGHTSFDDAEQVIKLSADKTNLTVSESGIYIVSAAARFGGMSFASDDKYRGIELLMYVNSEFLETAVATVVVGANGSLRGAQYAAMPARPYRLNANDKISLKYRLNAGTDRISGQINYAALSVFRVSR